MSPRRAVSTLVAACLLLPAPPAVAVTGSWSLLTTSPVPASAERHDDLWFVDALNGWLVNGDGEIYATADGGGSWAHVLDTGAYNRCVTFADRWHGVVGHLYANGGSPLLVTGDAGATWTPVSLPAPVPEGLCGLWAASEQVIYGVGAFYGSPTLVKSADGGASWITRDMSPWAGALVDCYFWHPDSGLAVGSTAPGSTRQPLILMTADGGVTWSLRWMGTRTRELCWKISFVSRDVGFVSLENLTGTGWSYFLKTKDGGLNWEEKVFEPAYRNCQGIGFVDEDTGWLGGWDFNTEATRDGGVTWSPAGFGYQMNRFRFLDPNLGWACGDRVYKWTGDVSGVADLPDPPRIRLLEQNSPNPFRTETRIAFRVEEAGPVTLKLYDVAGREVRNLFAGTKLPGRCEVFLTAGDLAPGVYTYRLATSRGPEARKMWVVR